MKLDSTLINARLLYLFENFLHNFDDNHDVVIFGLGFCTSQIGSRVMFLKRKAVEALVAIIKTSRIWLPISTFEHLAQTAKIEAFELLKGKTLEPLLSALVSLLPSWPDHENRVCCE